ncbi:MAG: hypothetical protein GQ527_01340, partial [Bacteroidales bacterium]|nr:hypothetical protein [Bacteroidales bacterium]
MKKILFYSILISLIVSCQSREIQIVEEIYQDGSSKKIVDYLVQGSDTLVLHELSFHKDGSKLMEGYFENNQREGEWLSWFPDGSIWSKGYFSK